MHCCVSAKENPPSSESYWGDGWDQKISGGESEAAMYSSKVST